MWLSADIYGAPVIAVCLHGGVWTVLTDTRFGLVSTVRLALAVLLALLILWPATRLLQLAAAAGLIVLIALDRPCRGDARNRRRHPPRVRHGASAGGRRLAGRIAGTRHAAGTRPPNRRPRLAQPLRSAQLGGFPWLGVVCVAALLASGIINSWNLLGGPRDLVTTDYGRLVLLKIGLFVAMVGIAAANRLHFTPQLPAASALRALQRNSLAETGLGVCVLLFVGALGTLSPSGHAHSTNADVPPNAAFVHIHTSEAMAEVTIEPGRTGMANAHIRVLRDDFSEYPARSVKFMLDPPRTDRR